jgi:uncharacterized damage-inducible protein DinB
MRAATLTCVAPDGIAADPAASVAVGALRDRLDRLMRVILALPDDLYATRTTRSSGAIGDHVRHVLDHVAALAGEPASLPLSYDYRTRGTAIEWDPGAALRELMRLDAALERWRTRSLSEPIAVTTVLDDEGRSVTSWSTLGREVAFVLSHTIHHQAMIALLLEGIGQPTGDARFGVAPSTPTAARRPCAP